MKTISLRKFRDSIPDLREVVSVSRREPDGNYQILGTWTPSLIIEPGYEPAGARAGFGSSRPAPKPKR